MPDTPTQLKVFVSHSGLDKAICDQVVGALRDAGADVWYDEHNLGAGQLLEEILREKACRWNADAEIQAIVQDLNSDPDGMVGKYLGAYSAEKAQALAAGERGAGSRAACQGTRRVGVLPPSHLAAWRARHRARLRGRCP
jgi:hypothetical protein